MKRTNQPHNNKISNLEEIVIFLEMYNLPRLNQEEIQNKCRKITTNELESVILKIPTNKFPESNISTAEFYQMLTPKNFREWNASELIL